MLSLRLSKEEGQMLDALTKQLDISKTAALRKGLRLLSLINQRIQQGDRIFYKRPDGEMIGMSIDHITPTPSPGTEGK